MLSMRLLHSTTVLYSNSCYTVVVIQKLNFFILACVFYDIYQIDFLYTQYAYGCFPFALPLLLVDVNKMPFAWMSPLHLKILAIHWYMIIMSQYSLPNAVAVSNITLTCSSVS